jgi:predicted phosphoribosyltransferase
VVNKITLPWNSESGYGAVAWTGTSALNEKMLPFLGLSPDQISAGKSQTLAKVRRRVKLFRGRRPFPELKQKTVILVDDGLASGFTMMVAAQALYQSGSEKIVVAVPTGHLDAVQQLAEKVAAVCCANIRSGRSFAVADAYVHWRDVTEEEVLGILPGYLGS